MVSDLTTIIPTATIPARSDAFAVERKAVGPIDTHRKSVIRHTNCARLSSRLSFSSPINSSSSAKELILVQRTATMRTLASSLPLSSRRAVRRPNSLQESSLSVLPTLGNTRSTVVFLPLLLTTQVLSLKIPLHIKLKL